ncbi:MAG: hypothetical protein R2769_16495 [Saprospiraceae bacterium]
MGKAQKNAKRFRRSSSLKVTKDQRPKTKDQLKFTRFLNPPYPKVGITVHFLFLEKFDELS